MDGVVGRVVGNPVAKTVVDKLKAQGFTCRPFKTYGSAQRLGHTRAAIITVPRTRGTGFTYYACLSPELRRKQKGK